jgi:two-component system OmpR family sensor kinase
MKNISIITFVNAIFVIAFLGVVSTYSLFSKMEKERDLEYQKQRYTLVANAFLSALQFFPKNSELQKRYKYFLVEPVGEKDSISILKNAQVLFFENSIFGTVHVLKLKSEHYIYIQSFKYNLLLKDINPRKNKVLIAFMLLLFFSTILLFIYFALLKKLSPLKKLNFEVQKFASGNLNPDIKDYGNDEIGKIAKSFKVAIKAIKEQIESKNLFMRNMMHELKTPITKGRIVSENIEDIEDRDILIGSFERMNEIITDLANVEKFTSKSIPLNLKESLFSDLVDRAIDLLMIDKNMVIKEYEDFKISVDKEYFTVVLKYLIDNGIKFSPDKKVTIKSNQKKIEIISLGEPLKYPLSYYIEPFSQEQKRSSGFGLGLYIVKSILDRHNIEFDYHHNQGHNIFELELTS